MATKKPKPGEKPRSSGGRRNGSARGFLERYLGGDRERVWHELRQLGVGWQEHEQCDEVERVVLEAMTRARSNVTILIERLRAQGYRFGDPWNEDGAREPLAPPDEHTTTFVAWLEERFGPLPLTVRTWIEVVGDVSFLGVHPEWPRDLISDPLVVEFEYKSWPWAKRDRAFARTHFESEREAWEDSAQDGPECAGAFALDVAPDALHKANISGGAPYGVLVPDASVDATFRFDDGLLLPFVAYLRLAFRCGGFPGLWNRDAGKRVWASRHALAEGLLDL